VSRVTFAWPSYYGSLLPEGPGVHVCPHCKQEIREGDLVHWWQDTLWHTKPCPGEVAS